jgi:hypothetical protein
MTTATQPVLTDAPAEAPGKKPAHVLTDRGLSVSVFANTATVRDREVTFFDSYIQRTYKDGEEFKKTHKLAKDDLLKAAQLLTQAWAWIVDEEAAARKEKKAA